MRYLYGFHDPGGEKLFGNRPGWIVHTVSLSEDMPVDYRKWTERGIASIVRLNWGYGSTGTLTLQENYGEFAKLCSRYIIASPGCHRWIIGNEPNHGLEWPLGKPISPEQYADCFLKCRTEIHKLRSADEVIVAAIAPWNERDSGSWINYFKEVIRILDGRYDGFAVHAYTHGSNPALIKDETMMNPPYQDCHWNFRVYRDWCDQIPTAKRNLPVYITEANQGDETWLDVNSGYVREMYGEISEWNKLPGKSKIHCVCLYRWYTHDQWSISNKLHVQEDFVGAVDMNLRSPESAVSTYIPSIYVSPSVPGDTTKPPVVSPTLPLNWDSRLSERGSEILYPTGLKVGDKYWKIVQAKWYDVNEVKQIGPDHHILIDVIDEAGNRIVGVPVRVYWSTDNHQLITEEKRGELASANYPVSPGENAFTVRIDDGTPSETISKIGMGQATPDGFNPGIHTSTFVQWQKATKSASEPDETAKEPERFTISYPIRNRDLSLISQRFGENPEAYKEFSVDGVPLRGHTGIDIAVPIGTDVLAVSDGYVTESADDPKGYGLYVKLSHTWGESLYAHLSAKYGVVGQKILGNFIVGISGNTGNSTGPHVHFAIRVHPFDRSDGWGGFTDPLPYVGGSGIENVEKPSVTKQAEYLREDEIILALRSALGNMGITARSVGLSRGQLQDYIVSHPAVREELAQIKESLIDDAEDELHKRIKNSDSLLMFFLRTQAKSRGYDPGVPLVGSGGESLSFKLDARGLIAAMRQGMNTEGIDAESEDGSKKDSTDIHSV